MSAGTSGRSPSFSSAPPRHPQPLSAPYEWATLTPDLRHPCLFAHDPSLGTTDALLHVTLLGPEILASPLHPPFSVGEASPHCPPSVLTLSPCLSCCGEGEGSAFGEQLRREPSTDVSPATPGAALSLFQRSKIHHKVRTTTQVKK